MHFKNMLSAGSNADQLQQTIFQEVQSGRIAGPFKNIPISNLRCSPIGVVQKKNQKKNNTSQTKDTQILV